MSREGCGAPDRGRDPVRFVTNEEIRRVLARYADHFPTRKAAAEAIGMKHRTFKSHRNGHIFTFPRRSMVAVLRYLREHDAPIAEIVRDAGAPSLRAMLIAKRVAHAKRIDEAELQRHVAAWLSKGSKTLGTLDASCRQALKYAPGGFGPVLRRAFASLRVNELAAFEAALDHRNFELARRRLRDFETAFLCYAERLESVDRAAPLGKKTLWRDEIGSLRDDLDLLAGHLSRASGVLYETKAAKRLGDYRADVEKRYNGRLYDHRRAYALGEKFHHPAFGEGRVCEVIDERRFVAELENGEPRRRVLVMNAGGRPPEWKNIGSKHEKAHSTVA